MDVNHYKHVYYYINHTKFNIKFLLDTIFLLQNNYKYIYIYLRSS